MSMIEGISLNKIRAKRPEHHKPVEYEIPLGMVPTLFDYIVRHDSSKFRQMKAGTNGNYNWLLAKYSLTRYITIPETGNEPESGTENDLKPCLVVLHNKETNRFTVYQLAMNYKAESVFIELLSEKETYKMVNKTYTAIQEHKSPNEPILEFNVIGEQSRRILKDREKFPNYPMDYAKDEQLLELVKKLVMKEFGKIANSIRR